MNQVIVQEMKDAELTLSTT